MNTSLKVADYTDQFSGAGGESDGLCACVSVKHLSVLLAFAFIFCICVCICICNLHYFILFRFILLCFILSHNAYCLLFGHIVI